MQTSPTTEARRSSRGLDGVNFFVATDSPWIGRRRLRLLPLPPLNAIGASLSTFFTGVAAAALGPRAAALGLAPGGICGRLPLWAGMPETRPRETASRE